MKVVIAGGGRAGLSVAIHLLGAGHAVTLLDRDAEVARAAFEMHGLVALAGDGTDPRLLHDAGMQRADVAVAMLPRDADNLAFAALSRACGAKRIMVRVKDETYRAIYKDTGVDRIISETEVFIGALATAIEHESVRTSMFLGNGGAAAFELQLTAGAQIAGRTVSEIAADPAFPRSCVFAGLYEPSGEIRAPRGNSVIAPLATLLLVAQRREISSVIEFMLRPA